MQTSPFLSRPLRSLETARRETRDEILTRLRAALDHAESLASDACADLDDASDANLIADILDHLRSASDDLQDITGRIAQVADDAEGAGACIEENADRRWARGR